MNVMRKQEGFTLVEIAIVLVIIGLLLGGILKGQEMITQAKIKNVIADMSGVSAAMYGYQDRYRALPGDDKNAPTRWTARPRRAVRSRRRRSRASGRTTGTEAINFWEHLRRAGFVSGSGVGESLQRGVRQDGRADGDGAGGTTGVTGRRHGDGLHFAHPVLGRPARQDRRLGRCADGRRRRHERQRARAEGGGEPGRYRGGHRLHGRWRQHVRGLPPDVTFLRNQESPRERAFLFRLP